MSQKVKEDGNAIGVWKFPGKKFEFEKQITLKQTNSFTNTYFANYVEWQGEARERLLLQHPKAVEFLRDNPHVILITYCVYHRFVENTFFGDKVRLEVTSRDIQKYNVVLIFRYWNVATGHLVGEGWQKVCFRDMKKNSICEVPQLILDLVEPIRENAKSV